MLLLTFLLVPVVLAAVQEKSINNYVVKIDGSTLRSVQSTGTSSRILDLSGLGLQILEKNVFDNLATMKSLNLGNNSLSSIPNGLFLKLGNLENLSLADNNITKFEKSFQGLDRLKTLNISNNPLTKFEATDLFGLPKSGVVFTKGLSLKSFNAYVFEKEPGSPYKHEVDDEEEEESPDENDDEDYDDDDKEDDDNDVDIEISKNRGRRRKRNVEKYNYIKICIFDDVLKMVEPLKHNATLPDGCQRANLSKYLSLENLGIAKFEKGWFRLDKTASIRGISFAGNELVQLTRDLLNDLPRSLHVVDLSRNKIERLQKGFIKNMDIAVLKLNSNRISEIETGALANIPRLSEIYLNDNLLTDTKFVATLPRAITFMLLQRNRITEITPGSFSRLHGLFFLYLDENLIQEVKSDSLHGLFSLMEIGLSNNRINKIEPGSFKRTCLVSLSVSNNSIAGFEKGVFDDRSRIRQLDISYNELTNVKDNFPDGFPAQLGVLKLDFNKINKLERDTFNNTPSEYLSLAGNNISEIERESFHLERLETLILDKNLLNELDADSFHSLKRLEMLSLVDNGITGIPEGFVKNMPNLDELDLSNNPIKQLQNGALYGFRRTSYNVVYLNEAPVEVIQGGLFDNI